MSYEIMELDQNIEGVWNSWTATCEVAVVMDGKKLNDVFSAIRQQLEYLRRQHLGMSDKFDKYVQNQHKYGVNHAHDPINTFVHDLMPSSDEHNQNVGHGNDHNNVDTNELIQNALRNFKMSQHAVPPPEQVLDAEELQILLDRIHALEQEVRRHNGFGDRLDKLEAHINTKFGQFQSHMDKLNARIDGNDAMEAVFEKKIGDLEENFKARLEQVAQSLDNQSQQHIRSTQETLASQKAEINELKEMLQISELRMKKAEGDIVRGEHAVHEVQETIDYFPVKYLDSIRNDIIELYTVKAGRDELSHKADISYAQSKADQEEVQRLEAHTLELLRRLDTLAHEMHDGFGSVDGKLDKRIDKVAHWCIKQLRKEIRLNGSGGGHDDGRDGADIGRVKCLVCDQTIVQHTETEIVHGGPPMKNVMKPFHTHNPQFNQQYNPKQYATRPRSASPPPSRGRGYGTGSTPQPPSQTTQAHYGERFQSAHDGAVTMPRIKPVGVPASTGGLVSVPANVAGLNKAVKLARIPGASTPPPGGTLSPHSGGVLPVSAGGGGNNLNENDIEFNEEVEQPEDFNYRVEGDVGGKPAQRTGSPVPATGTASGAGGGTGGTGGAGSGPARSQSTPALQQHNEPMRIQHAQMHGHGHGHNKDQPQAQAQALSSSATQAILQQQMLQLNVQQEGNYYFKDLEERFGTAKRNNNVTAAKQLNYKYDTRPSTAPQKRGGGGGMTGSKLKNSSTRPMPFEDYN